MMEWFQLSISYKNGELRVYIGHAWTLLFVFALFVFLSGCQCTSTLDAGCDPKPKWTGYKLEQVT